MLALGRVAQFEVEGNVAFVDLNVLQRLAGDEILAGVRVDDRFVLTPEWRVV